MRPHYYLLLILLTISGCDSCLDALQESMEEASRQMWAFQERIGEIDQRAMTISRSAETALPGLDSLTYLCAGDSSAGYGVLKIYRDSLGTVVSLKEYQGNQLTVCQLVMAGDTVIKIGTMELLAGDPVNEREEATPYPGYRPRQASHYFRGAAKTIAWMKQDLRPQAEGGPDGVVFEYQEVKDSTVYPLRDRLPALLKGNFRCPDD